MNITETPLSGAFIIEPKVFADERGYFFELYKNQFSPFAPNQTFVQDNISKSKKNVLRGLHYQLKFPQGKLVSVIKGSVFDVIVDIRQHSPTFKQWFGTELSDQNHKQIYIPPGFAHGFCVLSDEAYFHYKCTDYYHPEDDYGILWNDTELQIQWALSDVPVISSKDANHPELNSINPLSLPI